MADRIIVKCLSAVASSFASVVVEKFRSILSQEDLTMERGADASSYDDDYMCVVEVDDEEEQTIEIGEHVSCYSDKCHTDDDSKSNSFGTLNNKVMSTWYKCQSKLIHECAHSGWKLYPNPIIMKDSKEHATLEDTDAVKTRLFKLILSPTLVREQREIEKRRLSQEF